MRAERDLRNRELWRSPEQGGAATEGLDSSCSRILDYLCSGCSDHRQHTWPNRITAFRGCPRRRGDHAGRIRCWTGRAGTSRKKPSTASVRPRDTKEMGRRWTDRMGTPKWGGLGMWCRKSDGVLALVRRSCRGTGGCTADRGRSHLRNLWTDASGTRLGHAPSPHVARQACGRVATWAPRLGQADSSLPTSRFRDSHNHCLWALTVRRR
jgi:hypothetical protein